MTTVEIREGDVFRWRYSSDKLNDDYLSYWAKSRIATAQNGVLRDTYWNSTSDGVTFQYADVDSRIELEFIANFDTLERISEGEACYYADSDIVNLNHSNCPIGNCYKRKGTGRNRDVMIAMAQKAIERARSEVRSALRDAERSQETKAALEGGAALDGVWI